MNVDGVSWIVEAAENGSAECAFLLGFLHEHGLLVPQSFSGAAGWYKKAAERGLAAAQYALATLYEIGNGVEKNALQAHRYALLAARQELPVAQFMVGSQLMRGAGVAPDAAAARGWLEAGTRGGSKEAKSLLADALDEGLFGYQEKKVAHQYYGELADDGDAYALYMLASKLELGDGCEKDEQQALRLFHKAAELGLHNAAFRLAMIYSKGLLGVSPDNERSSYYLDLSEALYKKAHPASEDERQ